MGTVRKTVGLTDQQDTKLRVLKSAIQEGLDSGVSDKTVPQIMEEVEARLRADERLSTDKI